MIVITVMVMIVMTVPIDVTLPGITTLVNDVPAKTPSAIDVTVAGITTVVNALQ
jgi:hypothetical protein